ncbi:hypothetical protein BGZ99_003510 [Dissophora globulifera]|uniref:Uncharacterized protein n=1 Tax=Dissophora globulifera TaxID=979702 RepID=A0A9P6RK21_9FUNG|nr:hypothetical protein BGZ99_003510 [Dissophora globulifera]
MSAADVIAPSMASPARPKRGLASFKTMFSKKPLPSATHIPTSDESGPSSPTLSEPSTLDSPTSSEAPSPKSPGAVSSLFTPNQKRAQEKAAEKEKKEQVKQAIQLSDIDEQGAFIPPTPLEKGYKDHFKDNDEDHFYTIISTPPERVRTFLSAASTISPGMFSQPSSKIKRHTLAHFPSNREWSSAATAFSAATAAATSSPEFENEDPTAQPLSASSPPTVPPKDAHYSHNQPAKKAKNTRVHMAYLTGSDDLSDALSESIGSLLTTSSMGSGPSSPSQEVPDLMDDDDSSESSSANTSPRHSTASLQASQGRRQIQNHKKATSEQNFGGALPLAL